MSIEYKGYNIQVNADQDAVTKQWNGRCRILERKNWTVRLIVLDVFELSESKQKYYFTLYL